MKQIIPELFILGIILLSFVLGNEMTKNIASNEYCISQPKIVLLDRHLEITTEDQIKPLQVSFFWLRDHAR